MSDPRPDPLAQHAAERLARAAHAARALSETLWEALQEELARPGDPSVQGEGPSGSAHARALSERLGEVATTVALLARSPAGAGAGVGVGAEASSPRGAPAPEAGAEITPPRAASASASPAPPPPLPSPAPPVPSPPPADPKETPSSRVVLVDEHAPVPSQPPSSHAPAPPEIAVRDARGEEGRRGRAPAHPEERRPDPWVDAIARRLEGYERDRVPFAVLAVELVDIERLRQAELPGEVARLTGLVESALAGLLGPADSLTRATPGRYWLLAAETDAEAARALAQRLAQAVRGAVRHRGAPLELAAGVAACPADATRAGALAAHAEIALYAARAAGRPLAP